MNDLIEKLCMNGYYSKSERSVKIETVGRPKGMLVVYTHTSLLAQNELLKKKLAESSLGWKDHPNFHWSNNQNENVNQGFLVITKKGEAEIVKEDVIEKKEGGIEKEESGNQGGQKKIKVTIDKIIDENSPWRRTKKLILNEPNPYLSNYIKPLYSIIKKKSVQDDEELLKGMQEKVVKEHVNMTEKDDIVTPQSFPPKLKDPGKFTISCNIGGVKIPHALCDLGSSISVMPLKKVKELKVDEITPSNMTLILADSSIIQPLDFVVLDTKGDSRGYAILKWPFLATGKAKIDVETSELTLEFNKEKVIFKVYD
ncbi:uncharacterized protein LOC127122147 [Lathyrus oleraceus]|uniref:uncharacterized protein LOC127122147 n=1 Tax=Pisum sativum TaxID=3888 RepID=UPI0021D10A4D|nr:uncharacterized protein LOC127122147 [Pisum sativum]